MNHKSTQKEKLNQSTLWKTKRNRTAPQDFQALLKIFISDPNKNINNKH